MSLILPSSPWPEPSGFSVPAGVFSFLSRLAGFLALILSSCQNPGQQNTLKALFISKAYSIYPDRVVQGSQEAWAYGDSVLVTGYHSPNLKPPDPRIQFKFCINGQDNELPYGQNHEILCLERADTTPLLVFGKVYPGSASNPPVARLLPGTLLTVRVDLRGVFAQFAHKGYYTASGGKRIYPGDFHGVWVAGNMPPLTWDFANLATDTALQLQETPEKGIFERTLPLEPVLDTLNSHWQLSGDLGPYPRFHSGKPLLDALYNKALEEMELDIRPDSTFRAGAKWDGVWTRDISYSSLLSLAFLRPDICRNSLLKKVKDGRIIQDTGTGGSYPVSSDRMVWALAAWEIYRVTGDKAWLKQAYAIISHSSRDDHQTIYDPRTGMVHGESSFMDWREQSYPRWMQPADIYQSECLGTNAVHYRCNIILAQMSRLLGDTLAEGRYLALAAGIRKGINQYLWMGKQGYFAQYLYGRDYLIRSPKPESLGESLCILFGIASPAQTRSILRHTPQLKFGIPCFYPQIPGIPPYHNEAIWPFVESFWSLAAARGANEADLSASISAIYRAAALFGTNKENFLAGTGDYIGTQINSDRQLWSVAGNLALVYRIFFGMHFRSGGLVFAPFIPYAYRGTYRLEMFRYRNALLDIRISGYGNRIRSFLLDGKPSKDPWFPASLQGTHRIDIHLTNQRIFSHAHWVADHIAPGTPVPSLAGDTLRWRAIARASGYRVLRKGILFETLTDTQVLITPKGFGPYQVLALDSLGFESFASEPLSPRPGAARQQIYQLEEDAPASRLPYQGYTGKGFVETSPEHNPSIRLLLRIPQDGTYALDIRYANGNGPVNTDNKCAVRTLLIGGRPAGTLVFPQRGQGLWSDWGYSNPLILKLRKGYYPLELDYLPADRNMNGKVNQAMLDCLRVIRL